MPAAAKKSQKKGEVCDKKEIIPGFGFEVNEKRRKMKEDGVLIFFKFKSFKILQ